MTEDLYVIVDWVHDEPPFPRYSFATPKHAEELETNVKCLQTCASLEMAGQIVAQLNRQSGLEPFEPGRVNRSGGEKQ